MLEELIRALAVPNQRMFKFIEACAADDQARTRIPNVLARWCEHVFEYGSASFVLRVDRALRRAGWPTDKTPVSCSRCKGTGIYNGYRCYYCKGKPLIRFSIPNTVERVYRAF